MAEETTTPEAPAAAAAAGGGIKAWLPLIITIVLMPALAFGMAQFVLLPQLQKGLSMKPAAESPAESGKTKAKTESLDAKRESVTMTKLLVNIAGTMGQRYLLVSLSAVGHEGELKKKMEEHDAQLRDMACGVLQTKTLVDLEKPGARNMIRTELLTGFNNILGDASVQDIYFTEFAIQ